MNKQSDALANKKGIKGVQSRQFVRATAENAKNSTLSASAHNNAKISEKGTENALNRSADNPQIRKASGELVKKLKKQKRENHFLLFLDNQKIIKDAIAQGAKPIMALATSADLLADITPSSTCEQYLTTIDVISALSDVKTPRGVVVMLEYTQFSNFVENPKIPKGDFLVLDGIQDPGNAGTLIRSALAAGEECVFILDGVSSTNPKLIRSSAGAIFNIPVYSLSRADFVKLAVKNNLKLAMTDMDGENVFDFKPTSPIGIVVGNEGQGVSDEIEKISSIKLTIPMKKGIESLNAGVSGSVVMFEIASKRN